MSKIVISKEFELSIKDLQSSLTGLLLMAVGTLVTATIDVVITWMAGVDVSSITVGGYPVMIYLVPVITFLLNMLRKYIQANKYVS